MSVKSRTSALSRWLQFVAILRLFSVILGYFYPTKLAENLYSGTPEESTYLQTRTFATWTTTSCMLCLLCARNISNRGIYAATLGSFAIALAHFMLEFFIYESVTIRTVLQPLIIASISTLWMGAGWNYYTDYVMSMPASYSEEVTAGKTDWFCWMNVYMYVIWIKVCTYLYYPSTSIYYIW